MIQRIGRGWLARRRYKELKKVAGPNWMARQDQMKEFLNTERKYVSQLEKVAKFLFCCFDSVQ